LKILLLISNPLFIGIIKLSLLFLRVLPYGNGFAERAFAVKSPDGTTGIDMSPMQEDFCFEAGVLTPAGLSVL
jgi:hypothetical protein